MNILVAAINVILIFSIAYWLSNKTKGLKKIFWPSLILKLTAGILLGVVYKYYYVQADTFSFYEDGVVIAKIAHTDVVQYLDFIWEGNESFSIWSELNLPQPRALFFTKIVSVFNLLTLNNYWTTSLYFSFISFCFSWKLVVTLLKYFPLQKVPVVISFLFVPSVVFWSSGILKESLVMAAMFFIANVFITFWMRDRVRLIEWIGLMISVFVFWQLKYYYAALLLPILLTSLTIKFVIVPAFQIKKPWLEIAAWFLILIVPIFLVSLTRHNFHFENIFKLITQTSDGFVELSTTNGAIHYYELKPNPWSFILNSPLALFSGLFRPFVWEVDTMFQFLLALENFVILVFTIVSLRNCKELFISENRLLIVSVLTYSILLCIFLALSTPNFGTLSRYRLGFLPFFVFLIGCKNQGVRLMIDFIQRTFSRLVR